MARPVAWTRYLSYTAGLGIIGAAQMLALAGLSAGSLVCAGTFLLLATGAGLGLAWAEPAVAAQLPDATSNAALGDVCSKSLTVWARQIDTSRLTANDAVLKLTELFEGTVEKLEAILAAAAAALAQMRGHDGMVAAVGHGDDELLRAMQTLVSAQKSREEKVGLYARELREMASDVQSIAMQIRLLSFNAAVEAARAGHSAGGFAVVASEMRELADVSGEKGAGIARKVQAINATLEEFVRGESAAHTEIDSVSEAESSIRDVMQRFRQLAILLSDAVKVMEEKTGQVHGDVSDALVAMQFQDRVSQIQQHVVSGLNAMGERLGKGGAGGFDARDWSARMVRDLSMQEEFDNLRGRAGDSARRGQGHEMTFF